MNFSFHCYAVLGLCLVVLSCPAWAEEARQYTDKDYWDAIAKRPDATITITKDPTTGAEIKTAKFKGGVTITSTGDNRLEEDTSGIGAVSCVREIMILTLEASKICSQLKETSMSKDMEEALQRVDAFIIQNSILPVTQAELDVNRNATHERYSSMRRACSDQEVDKLNKELWDSQDKNMAEINQMLTVPRPPVMNPCL